MNPTASTYDPSEYGRGEPIATSGVSAYGYYPYHGDSNDPNAHSHLSESSGYHPHHPQHPHTTGSYSNHAEPLHNPYSVTPNYSDTVDTAHARADAGTVNHGRTGYYAENGYFVPSQHAPLDQSATGVQATHHPSYHHHQDAWYGDGDDNDDEATTTDATAAAQHIAAPVGSFYPVVEWQSPPLYQSPVSAVAYDLSYDALYAATVTLASASTTGNSTGSHAGSGASRSSRLTQQATRMVTHGISNWPTNDTEATTTRAAATTTMMLYSCVSSHPEAPSSVLNALYPTIYGSPTGTSTPNANSSTTPSTHTNIPSHAYTPPYGKADPIWPDISGTGNHHLGVTCLLPVSEGTVASVSPAGTRVHALGGLQLADQHIEGLVALAPHPTSSLRHNVNADSVVTHLMVGGMALANQTNATRSSFPNGSSHHLHCLDVWQGLQIVSSHTLDRHVHTVTTNTASRDHQRTADCNPTASLAVTTVATNHSRGCVAVGCSDGTLRLVDDRSRDLAALKCHKGGVVDVAMNEGSLVATTGYGSVRHQYHHTNTLHPLYGYPDPTILLYDLRYLGRGGFPYSFAGLSGGPRYVNFLPDMQGQPSNRLLVASGQVGGGCQIIVPFQETQGNDSAAPSFLLPNLDRGESISALCVTEDRLVLGTNQGKLLQYRMAGFVRSKDGPDEYSSSSDGRRGIFIPPSSLNKDKGAAAITATAGPTNPTLKKQLTLPAFAPPLSDVTLEATLLLNGDNPTMRMGETDKIKSIAGAYIFTGNPSASAINGASHGSLASFGPLVSTPLVAQCRLKLSTTALQKASRVMDFVQTIPVSELKLDLFDDFRPKNTKERKNVETKSLYNPNKFLYNNELVKVVYGESYNRSKRYECIKWSYGQTAVVGDDDELNDKHVVPKRYRLTLRPTHKSASSFRHSEYNETGTIPGFDYPLTMPNSFVPPIVLLVYLIPELREAALMAQLGRALTSSREQGLITELGYLFHRIDTLAKCGPLFPANENSSDVTRIEAWSPISLISYISTMPETDRFQILDGSPAAVDSPRRPEAFYRFLMYQLDTEINRGPSTGALDSLCGIDFVSINEFVSGSGPPSKSTTRSLTVELIYDQFVGAGKTSNDNLSHPAFRDVLHYNLCRSNRLRAWNQSTLSYETIVQRKIATSLPTILSLSAACAGRNPDQGLNLWQSTPGGDAPSTQWLPEMIEVEIKDNGAIVVRERVYDATTGTDAWKECHGTGGATSHAVSAVVKETLTSSGSGDGPRKRRYRLDAVVSLIRDDLDRFCPEEVRAQDIQGPFGHHVLHARVSKDAKKRIRSQQYAAIHTYLSSREHNKDKRVDLTLMGRDSDNDSLRVRLDYVQKCLASLDQDTGSYLEADDGSEWVSINGFVVTNTTVDDARSFHWTYKEPSLVVFRAVDHAKAAKVRNVDKEMNVTIPPEIIQSTSVTSTKSIHAASQKPSVLPGPGDLVAFDAEFVAVAEEEAVLTTTGSKLTIRETRHAVARISILDGRPRSLSRNRRDPTVPSSEVLPIILDDHVQPNEAVTDYLTRFSGIVERDLNPKHSRHHLITSRQAYLKLRCFVERGCIFVGHGLAQDFSTANLAVPASQIIDTVDIYHKPAQRYISLRFLTNYLLQRDMQQDVHNSVEDASAAWALYLKALELKQQGEFDRVLDELYQYGQKCDWKLGVDGGER